MNKLQHLQYLNFRKPSRYADNITAIQSKPSLDLNFARNKSLIDNVTGNNLVTFTRTSGGTFVDSNGVLRSAVTNLQRHSEDFTQGLTTNNATLTANQGTAPNGTLTADEYLETTANGLHSQEIADHTFIAGVVYTFSCYAKSIGGRNFGPGFPTLFGSARFGFFNLSGSGSVVSTDAGVTASIQAVGNNWYRCSITSTCVTGGGARVGVFISSGTSISYVGDITKGLLLWGAQLEQSSTMGEYVPTGATINSAPRFDHNPTTGESLGLLIEEQRTNLLVRSEELDSASWLLAGILAFGSGSIANATTAPNGTTTAEKLVEASGGTTHFASQQATISSGTVYTLSVYAKAAERSRVALYFGGAGGAAQGIIVNLTNGTFAANIVAAPTSYSITFAGSGWYRISITATSVGTVASHSVYICNDSNAFSYSGDGTSGIYLWGAQLEAGASPTSYIPTTASAATRSADIASITGTNFSSWYNQTEGTIFCDAKEYPFASGVSRAFYGLDASSAPNTDYIRQWIWSGASGSLLSSVYTSASGPVAAEFTQLLTNEQKRVATAVKVNDFARSYNGNAAVVDAAGNMPVGINRLGVGSTNNSLFMSGHIRRLTYFPQRLSNANLQRITQ